MKAKLIIEPSKIDAIKLQRIIEKLTELGVYRDGKIDCEPELDAQVMEIIDEALLTFSPQG